MNPSTNAAMQNRMTAHMAIGSDSRAVFANESRRLKPFVINQLSPIFKPAPRGQYDCCQFQRSVGGDECLEINTGIAEIWPKHVSEYGA